MPLSTPPTHTLYRLGSSSRMMSSRRVYRSPRVLMTWGGGGREGKVGIKGESRRGWWGQGPGVKGATKTEEKAEEGEGKRAAERKAWGRGGN